MNAYMLCSPVVKSVYIAWVRRMKTLQQSGEWSDDWQHAFQQVARMQRMYDCLEDGRIIYMWHWHQIATAPFRHPNVDGSVS